MNKNDFKYFFREGTKSMFSHGFMSVASIGITIACLLIIGNFSLIAYNAAVNVNQLLEENVVVAFIGEDVDMLTAKEMQGEIELLENVKDASFVSKEAARDSYVSQYDNDELYSDLDADVFRHRYVIHLQNIHRMEETVAQLERIEGIDKVRADSQISQGFTTIKDVALIISLSMVGTLVIVSLFIISNTIKMTFFDRKEEIAIMRIVGATKSFIRWPFVFEGFQTGVMSGLVSFALQTFIYTSVTKGIEATDSVQILSVVSYDDLWYFVFGAFLLGGILIGTLGSLMAIRRYVKV